MARSRNQLNHVISELHGHSVLLESRELFFFGDIDEDFFSTSIKNISLLNWHSKEPITIYLSSLGGEIDLSFGIYDRISNLGFHVNIICTGRIYSAGTIIMLAGDSIKSYTNSSFLIHTISSTIEDRHYHILSEVKFTEEVTIKKMKKLYVNRLVTHGYNARQATLLINKKMKEDWYFTTEEAKELGFIDEII